MKRRGEDRGSSPAAPPTSLREETLRVLCRRPAPATDPLTQVDPRCLGARGDASWADGASGGRGAKGCPAGAEADPEAPNRRPGLVTSRRRRAETRLPATPVNFPAPPAKGRAREGRSRGRGRGRECGGPGRRSAGAGARSVPRTPEGSVSGKCSWRSVGGAARPGPAASPRLRVAPTGRRLGGGGRRRRARDPGRAGLRPVLGRRATTLWLSSQPRRPGLLDPGGGCGRRREWSVGRCGQLDWRRGDGGSSLDSENRTKLE